MTDRINVFMLPFAGASKYSYKFFETVGNRKLNFISLELPGRGSRFAEPLLKDLDAMATDAFRHFNKRDREPYIIYGHSMGSIVGYLLARKIIKEKLRPPNFLFLTGRGGPSSPRREPDFHKLPREEFIAKIKQLGGSPDEVLSDPKILDFFEPILKADFEAVATYKYQPDEKLDIPIVIGIGTHEGISLEEAMSWQAETLQEIELVQFQGNHFFIFSHAQTMSELIVQRYELHNRKAMNFT